MFGAICVVLQELTFRYRNTHQTTHSTNQHLMSTNQSPSYPYYLDGDEFTSDSSSVSGATVRSKLPAEKAGYAIYQESKSKEPDKLVLDEDGFSLESELIYFYSVPSATFGNQ